MILVSSSLHQYLFLTVIIRKSPNSGIVLNFCTAATPTFFCWPAHYSLLLVEVSWPQTKCCGAGYKCDLKPKVGKGKEANKCVEIFLKSVEVKTLDFVSLMESLHGREVSLKYLQRRLGWHSRCSSLQSLSSEAKTEKTALSCTCPSEKDFGLSLLFMAAKLTND